METFDGIGDLVHVRLLDLVHSLSRVSHLPALKKLKVDDCPMLECVEKLESLQSLKLIDYQENNTSLPRWLISFLQQCEEKPHDDLFMLHLKRNSQALEVCLKGRSYWSFLQQVPRFTSYAENQRMYLKYTNEPYYYETNITGVLLILLLMMSLLYLF